MYQLSLKVSQTDFSCGLLVESGLKVGIDWLTGKTTQEGASKNGNQRT